jgi:phosphocarrier protein
MTGPGTAGSRPTTATVAIANVRGLHARASAKFVAVADSFEAAVTVTCGEWAVSGHSIMGLMMLGAGQGEMISIAATGPQAAEAVEVLARLVEDRFGEKE